MYIHKSINNENNPTRPLSDIKSPIMHHTGNNAASKDYLNRKDYISAHYNINKKGEIWQLMDDNRVAYHAGVSEWHSLETKGNSLNWCTIGIEIDSDGYDFTDAQRKSAKELLLHLMDLYNIPANLVLRHKDIAPSRKWDIGEAFYAPLKSWGEYQLTLTNMTPQEVKLTELNIAVCGNSYDNGNDKQKALAKKHAGELRDLLTNK